MPAVFLLVASYTVRYTSCYMIMLHKIIATSTPIQSLTPPINVSQGDLFWGKAPAVIKTTLGSCIALTVWHPKWHVGGMCHFVLPKKTNKAVEHKKERYADGVMETLLEHITNEVSQPAHYEVQILGGSTRLPYCNIDPANPVGLRNSNYAYELVSRHGFTVTNMDIGGAHYREVLFDLSTGSVAVEYFNPDTY